MATAKTPKPLKSIEVQLAEAVARAEVALAGGAQITFTGEMKATSEKFWACTSKTTPGLAYTIKSDGHRCYCTCKGSDDPRFICWHRGAAYVQQVYAGIGKLASATDAYFDAAIQNVETERKEAAQSVEPETQDDYEQSIAPEANTCAVCGDPIADGERLCAYDAQKEAAMLEETARQYVAPHLCSVCKLPSDFDVCGECQDVRKAQTCQRMAGHLNDEREFSYFKCER